MDEKTQEEVKGKEAQESQERTPTPGAVDTQDRPTTEDAPKEAPDMITRANFAAERLEKASAESKKQNDRAEKLAADQIASGRGQMVPAQTPLTQEQIASRRRIKAVADVSGSSWGKNYE